MSSPLSILILGATGYIGGSVLTALLKVYPASTLVVQYRQDAHEEVLLRFSSQIRPLTASLDDVELLRDEASKADVVINCADCDHLHSIQALVDGLEQGAAARVEHHQAKAIYLHTSGMAELVDPNQPQGESSPTVYDDSDLEQIKSMGANRAHRAMTNVVLAALERGHFVGFVILPCAIYGPGTGPLNQISIQIPALIENALQQRQVQYLISSTGTATNTWCHVHIGSLTKLYVDLLALAVANPLPVPKDGIERYVLASNGTHLWKDVAVEVGKILYGWGLVDQPGAIGVPGPIPGMTETNQGTHAVGRSENAQRWVGWEDKEGKGFWGQGLKGEVDRVVSRWRARQQSEQKAF